MQNEQRLQALATAAIQASKFANASAASEDVRWHSDAIRDFVAVAKGTLGVDLAVVSEFCDGHEVTRYFAGEALSFGVQIGKRMTTDTSFSELMVLGRISHVVTDAQQDKRVNNLSVTLNSHIGSFAGVPIKWLDGRLYGVLACYSHEPNPNLCESDLEFLCVISRFIADRLE